MGLMARTHTSLYIAILSLDHGLFIAQHNIPPSTHQWVKVLPSTGILPYVSNGTQSQRSQSHELSWFISPITMVYMCYIYSFHGIITHL